MLAFANPFRPVPERNPRGSLHPRGSNKPHHAANQGHYESNPPLTTWLIGAAAVLALAGATTGAIVYVKHKKKQQPPAIPPAKPPHQGGGKHANYVGSGWDWPKKWKYPDEKSFGKALENLGYGDFDWTADDFTVLHAAVMQAVKEFQADWNYVKKHSDSLSGGPKSVDVDGLIGTHTIDALEYAEDYEDAPGSEGWTLLVDQVHKNQGVS